MRPHEKCRHQDFDVEKIGNVSESSRELCQWTFVVDLFNKDDKEVEPLNVKVKELNEKLVDKKLKKKNTTLIYNGISVTQQINLTKTINKNVVTVANLSNRKGYEDYLKAIVIVVNKIPESQFLFLGKDNLDGKIQQLIIDVLSRLVTQE